MKRNLIYVKWKSTAKVTASENVILEQTTSSQLENFGDKNAPMKSIPKV